MTEARAISQKKRMSLSSVLKHRVQKRRYAKRGRALFAFSCASKGICSLPCHEVSVD